jgi:hypothetical protein
MGPLTQRPLTGLRGVNNRNISLAKPARYCSAAQALLAAVFKFSDHGPKPQSKLSDDFLSAPRPPAQGRAQWDEPSESAVVAVGVVVQAYAIAHRV